LKLIGDSVGVLISRYVVDVERVGAHGGFDPISETVLIGVESEIDISRRAYRAEKPLNALNPLDALNPLKSLRAFDSLRAD
jgi:hypothetical protein